MDTEVSKRTMCLECGLTPELSRADLRPSASENEQNSHEAAKRARLERIVSPQPDAVSSPVPGGRFADRRIRSIQLQCSIPAKAEQ